jgi:hypothetical protein
VNKTIYLTKEEAEWVKRQGPGWLRHVVKKYMKAYPDVMPAREVS